MTAVDADAGALGGRRLVLTAALAPAAWLVHLSAMPALVPLACSTGATWPMAALTAVCVAVAAAGVVQLHRGRQVVASLSAGSSESWPDGVDEAALQRGRLWCGAGLLTGWLFLVLIVVEFLPTLVVDACPP